MKLQRHKFKYLAYVFELKAGTLVPIDCYLEYVLPIDAEQLEFSFERAKVNAEADIEAKDEDIALRDAVITALIRDVERLNSEIKSLQWSLRESLADKDVELDYD